HRALLPHHQRRHRLRALDVRNVEALDACRWFRQRQRVLQRLLHRLGRRLQYPETLVKRLLRVLTDEIDEGPLVTALRNRDLDLVPRAVAQSVGKELAVGKSTGT